MFAIAFPSIDPVAFAIGPFAVRWYALGYLAGVFLGIWYVKSLVRKPPRLMTPEQVDDFMIWVLLGVIIGGRLGFVLFYKPGEYFSHPLDIFKTWEGGMSFHGGTLGVIAAIMLYARRVKIEQWALSDGVGCAMPIGIGLVRVTNFINGELWGRTAPDVPWAMVFPGAGDVPRHPSQLYEAGLEGFVLFWIMWALARSEKIRSRPGTLTGAFLIGYGVFRITCETFREPDIQLGFLALGMTMGQWLSVPMVLFGLYSIWRAKPVAQ